MVALRGLTPCSEFGTPSGRISIVAIRIAPHQLDVFDIRVVAVIEFHAAVPQRIKLQFAASRIIIRRPQIKEAGDQLVRLVEMRPAHRRAARQRGRVDDHLGVEANLMWLAVLLRARNGAQLIHRREASREIRKRTQQVVAHAIQDVREEVAHAGVALLDRSFPGRGDPRVRQHDMRAQIKALVALGGCTVREHLNGRHLVEEHGGEICREGILDDEMRIRRLDQHAVLHRGEHVALAMTRGGLEIGQRLQRLRPLSEDTTMPSVVAIRNTLDAEPRQ